MTLYTPRQRFPYPASREEYGNAGAQLEALAVTADAALDRVTANWVAYRHPGAVLYKLTSNVSIPVANGLTDITPQISLSMTTVATSAGIDVPFPFSQGHVNALEYGWWDVSVHVASQPAGAANAGTRRYLQAQKINFSNQAGNDNVIYVAEDEETTTGGVTAHELNFFIRADAQTAGIFLAYFHGNTSSAVNILATGTFMEAYQVSGPVS